MGGSGGHYTDHNKSEFKQKLKDSTSEEERQKYEIKVAQRFSDLLKKLNDRNTEAINTHIEQIKNALGRNIETGDIKTNFGGSLSRKTHLNGFSDVDVLIILNNTDLSLLSPSELLQYFYDTLKERFPSTEIKQGDTAVTVSFNDIDIQLLPALSYKTGVKIPDGDSWSEIVRPKEFAETLTALNDKFSKQLVPMIKLAKAIIYKLPEKYMLSGYHIESLACEIFDQRPSEVLKTKEMLKIFFSEASSRIQKPIEDISGQSDNVDDYLGKKDGLSRKVIANYLQRISTKMNYADDTCSQTNWDELLDL